MHTCACDILSSLVSQYYSFTQYIQIHPLGTYLEEQIIQKLVNDLSLTCDLKTLLILQRTSCTVEPQTS